MFENTSVAYFPFFFLLILAFWGISAMRAPTDAQEEGVTQPPVAADVGEGVPADVGEDVPADVGEDVPEDVDREPAWWMDYHGVEGDGVPGGTPVPRTPSPTPTMSDFIASGRTPPATPALTSSPTSPVPATPKKIYFELETP